MEGWSALLSPPECQFYHPDDWNPPNNNASSNASCGGGGGAGGSSNANGGGGAGAGQDTTEDHHTPAPQDHPQPPLLQEIISCNNALPNSSNNSSSNSPSTLNSQNPAASSSSGESWQMTYSGNLLKNAQHNAQFRSQKPAGLAKVAVGIPVSESGTAPGGNNNNRKNFPGAPSEMINGAGCPCGSPFCFPWIHPARTPPYFGNDLMNEGFGLEGIADKPMEGIQMEGMPFLMPMGLAPLVPPHKTLMAKSLKEGEWRGKDLGQKAENKSQRKQIKDDSGDEVEIARRKRKRSAGLDELTFEGFFQGEKVLYQRYIRRWRNDRNLIFYDCACGRRKAVHDLKKIKTHVDKIHTVGSNEGPLGTDSSESALHDLPLVAIINSSQSDASKMDSKLFAQ